MEGAGGLREDEVVDEGAVNSQGLSAHAGRRTLAQAQVRQDGYVAGRGGEEAAAAGGHRDLGQAGSPEAPRQPPGARPRQGVEEVAPTKVPESVAVAGGYEQRRRTEDQVTVDELGDVDAQEGEVGVRDGIDESPHDGGGGRVEGDVGPAEGDDARVAISPRGHRQSVRPEARAGDHGARADQSASGLDEGDVALAAKRDDPGREVERRPRLAQLLGHRRRDEAVVDDAGVGAMQRGDAATTGLDLGDLTGVESSQTRHAIGPTPTLELIEARQLALLEGHDEFAAAFVGDGVLVAELVHQGGALDAEARLE